MRACKRGFLSTNPYDSGNKVAQLTAEDHAGVHAAGLDVQMHSVMTAPWRGQSIPQGRRREQAAQGDPTNLPATVPKRGLAWRCHVHESRKGRASHAL